MNYLGRFINNFRHAYKEINSATLTGAIDIIVVEQPDGTFSCSPFHVRFGKLGVLRSREKIVEIEINGEPLNIYMKLGESGEAFFVEEVDDDISIPEHLICSPIPDSEESGDQEFTSEDNKSGNVDETNKEEYSTTELDKTAVGVMSLQSQIIPSVGAIERASTVSSDMSEDEDDDSANRTDVITDNANNEQRNLINNNVTSVIDYDVRPQDLYSNRDDLKIPNVDFKPIRSVSDNENSYVDIKNDDNAAVGISKSARKSVPTLAKRKRKKKINTKKKTQNKTHDVLASNVITNENLNDIVSDTRDNTSAMQMEEIRQDEIQNAETDLNNNNDSQVPMTSVSDLHFFSDTEVTTAASNYDRFFAPVQSDTEFEITSRQAEGTERALSENSSSSMSALSHTSWKWGELPSTVPKSESYDPPGDKTEVETKRSTLASMLGFMKRTKHIRQKSVELKDGGIYLSQLLANELDPDVANLYIPHSIASESDTLVNKDNFSRKQVLNGLGDDSESGKGPSLPHSPISELDMQTESDYVYANKSDRSDDDIAISLCGSLYSIDNFPSTDLFDQHLITYEQFVNDPAIFQNPNIVFRVNGKIYKWETACPLILSLALFGKPLPEDVISRLEQERVNRSNNTSKVDEDNKNRYRRGYYSWFNWARSRQQKNNDKPDVGISIVDGDVHPVMEKPPLLPSKSSPALVNSSHFNDTEITNIIGEGMELNTPTASGHDAERYRLKRYSSSESEYEPESELINEKLPEKYRKTLRLSSQQIASLNLRDGSNEVVFSVTTAYQGTTRCWCNLFKWRFDDKIVVSDIDGTITKSDVLGHIMPIVGNDWAQSGVAKLFNKIKDNGYQLLYLSSRAIGQSRGTRKYLYSIKQEDLTLPEGPLLLNPTSLLTAFHREVIEKKPEKFKISCLRDIQALFPQESNPFYAGYGNRINDVWSYQAVGIPIFRIFTINHRGELKHELTQTFQSSYFGQYYVVDSIFPPSLRISKGDNRMTYNFIRRKQLSYENSGSKLLRACAHLLGAFIISAFLLKSCFFSKCFRRIKDVTIIGVRFSRINQPDLYFL